MERTDLVKILALNPGTRHMGVAVMEGNELIFATVKIVKHRKMSPEQAVKKARRIVLKLIADYAPEQLAVESKVSVQAKKSPLLNQIIRAFKDAARQRQLSVFDYSSKAVRKFICPGQKPTKLNCALVIATKHYPWLYRYYEKDCRKKWWEEKYWANMFDAIALGLACFGMDARKTTGK